MRRLIILSALCVSPAVYAQNYVQAERYNNPDVIVNLDILSGGVSSAPVYSAPLPLPQVMKPIQLKAPTPRPMPQAVAPILPPPVIMPAPAPIVKEEPQSNVRQLLAQARAEAAAEELPAPKEIAPPMAANRSPILFDDVPPAPPQNELNPPQAMPAPIVENTPVIADAPMPLTQATPDTAPLVKELAARVAAANDVPAKEEKDDFEAYRLFFDPKASELKSTEEEILHNVIVKLKRDENIHVQILSYAAGTPDTVADARRLSLTRALTVRTAMLSDGIKADRINVRAMGMGDTSTMSDKKFPPDRVDIVFER